MKSIALYLSIAFLFQSTLCAQPSTFSRETITASIDEFIEEAINAVEVVPGLGIAIVSGDSIIYAKGYGLRDAENNMPVTTETGFYIASMTKPLVCLAAAQLEEQGLINLDDPLSLYYPEWEFNQSIDYTNISLVDLMSHTHPINNGGLQYRIAFIEEPEPVEFTNVLLDFSLPRTKEFRYSNTSINIAAGVIQKITGKNWREILAENVLGPLQMTHTTSYMSNAVQRNFAFPYIKLNDRFQRLNLKVDSQMGSAGGTVTTTTDMAHWIIANLNNGVYKHEQSIPQAVIKRVQKNYTSLDRTYYKFRRFGYGLGLYHSEYEGDLLMHHFGSYNGYMAHASFMPEHKFGVVAFTNTLDFGGRLPHIVAAYIYDLLLEKPGSKEKYQQELLEWNEEVRERITTATERLQAKDQMLASAHFPLEKLTVKTDLLTGNYYNPRIGKFNVSQMDDGQLLATYGSRIAPMYPVNNSTFLVDWKLTGFVTPPIQLDIKMNGLGNFAGLSYGGREFRKIPSGVTIKELIEMYQQLRGEIKKIATSEVGLSEQVKTILLDYYKKGAVSEPYVSYRGNYYEQEQNYKMANALYSFNIFLYPESADAHSDLAEIYIKTGDFEQARKHFQMVLDLNPGDENAINKLEEINRRK